MTIAIHILPNISISKGRQTMRFCLLIEDNKRNNFFKNHAENKARTLAPDLLLNFKKALYEVKASGI